MKLRLVLLLLALAAAGLYAAFALLQPHQGFSREVSVDIRRGAGTFEIAAQLAEAGVLRSEWSFLLMRALRPRALLKAGEYHFDRPLSPLEVFRKIAAGDVVYYSLTVPEGYTMFEIADAVARTGLLTRQEFLLAAQSAERIRDLAPRAHTLEGFLFPDTYRLTRHITAGELAAQMLRRFREVYQELHGSGDAYETVVLASLIEKETPVSVERPIVASVFRNRLRVGMALQCDPTVIYALQVAGRYQGELRKDDLAFHSPYNTYANPGLPPGPIANPGRASLRAALQPAATDYLYFVADGKGGHVFSTSFDRHSEAAARYRRVNNRRPAPRPAQKPHARRR